MYVNHFTASDLGYFDTLWIITQLVQLFLPIRFTGYSKYEQLSRSLI
jgi:hypothetical protein